MKTLKKQREKILLPATRAGEATGEAFGRKGDS